MDRFQRASQIWPVLTLASSNRQVLTYEILGRLIGVPRQGLGPMLEPIQSYCMVKGLPSLTSLVVSKITGLPSPGFTAANDVPKEHIRVFTSDWLSEKPPTPEMLEQAVKEKPPNGMPIESNTADESEMKKEHLEWVAMGLKNFARAYGDDEPEYTLMQR